MQPVPNQPIAFNYAPDCNLIEANWQAVVQDGDVSQFQFTIDNCTGEPDLVRNGIFTEDGGAGTGWSISPSNAWLLQPYFGNIKHLPNTAQGCVEQILFVADGTLVQITFTIVQTQGQCTVSYGTWSETYTGAVSGTFSYWIVADSGTTLRFCAKGLSDATWGSISMIPYNTTFRTRLVDMQGNVVLNSPATYNVFNGWATFSIDWEALNLDYGCYMIEVADPCECAQTGLLSYDFYTGVGLSAINPWACTTSPRWSLGAGTAAYLGSGVPGTGSILLQNSPLCVGTTYTVTYTLTNMTNNSFRVQLGSTLGTLRTIDGTFTEQITCATAGSVTLIGASVGSASDFEVSDLSIVATTITYSWQSVPLRYGSWDDCYKAIKICNDTDAMGMGFESTGFAPWFRTLAHMRRTGYTGERNRYRDGFGRSKDYYGESEPVTELAFDAPEYIHDFVRLGGIADHFYVDSSEFEFEGDEYPTMNLNENDDVSGVAIPLVPKVVNTVNRRENSVSHGCATDGLFIEAQGVTVVGGRTPSIGRPISTEGKPINFDG